jgi:hypothetical protein
MKVWLDDVRPKPDDFDVWLTDAAAAIRVLRTGGVTHISLDHDLGDTSDTTGYDVAKFIEEAAYKGLLAPLEVSVHSANPVGRKNIERAIERARGFWVNW